MLCMWFILKPKSMSVNNGIVYFDFSPLTLVIFTAVCYVLICVFRKFIKPESKTAKRVEVTAFLDNRKVSFTSILDTGNSLVDSVTNTPVIVADKKVLQNILKNDYEDFINANSSVFADRYRLIPIKTVSGGGMLTAVKCDYLKIDKNIITGILIAESETAFSDDYSAVINPEILEVY